MNTPPDETTDQFLDPKDLELLILKLRELARSLDENADSGYTGEIAEGDSVVGSQH